MFFWETMAIMVFCPPPHPHPQYPERFELGLGTPPTYFWGGEFRKKWVLEEFGGVGRPPEDGKGRLYLLFLENVAFGIGTEIG